MVRSPMRGHRPDGGKACVEVVETSELLPDDVVWGEDGWYCVLEGEERDSSQVVAAPIIDDAGGQGESLMLYGETFLRAVQEPACVSAPVSAAAVRAACAAVPALDEARRRRLRWADEAHAQILAVPVPAQPAPDGRGEAVVLLMDVLDALVDCVDGTNSPRHASLEDRVRAFVNRSLPTKLQALPRTHPTPRAEAYVEWCARHANIEKVPGPFCPACAYASVMRDGVKMGRESAPRAQPAPEGAGEAVAWEATGRYGGAPATEYGDSEENARMIYRSRYGAAPDSVRPLVYASPSRPGGA